MTQALSPLSQRIWDMKYRLKDAEGRPLDETVEASWRRIARALAAAERDPALWEQRFYEALEGFKVLPAGRIQAGAGTDRQVTLFNCFVMGTVPDDMGGIFAHLREAALTLQQGGGIGYDFSTLRPRGALVKGVGADASGPVSFMEVWDAMCRTIMSAGSRRGAMMATLACDHPDIESFIDAKRTAGRLTNFNLSVLVSDAFLAAVDAGADWPLQFGGKVYRRVPAPALWDRIMRATWETSEPGVIFIDRINRRNNLAYCETIAATNPCVTADTWVMTAEGPRQVAELLGRPFRARVQGEDHDSGGAGFFATGRKAVLRLTTVEGQCLRLTADHPLLAASDVTRFRVETTWRTAGSLRPGDRIVLQDHRRAPAWPGRHGEAEGYLLGLLIGDGTLKADKAVLSVWPGEVTADGSVARGGMLGVMAAAESAARSLPHRADFSGWIAVPGRGERRLALGALKALAGELGLAPGRKRITPAIERQSSDFYRGFLRGLFDSDGSVQGTTQKGQSLRLAQSDLPLLQATQRMLQRLGILSQIQAERRPAGSRRLPDGKGGARDYATRAQHELIISGENIDRFAALIGFRDGDKQARLAAAVAGLKRRPNRARFLARVAAVEPDGEAEVFDVQVPGINAFDANGLVAHNCGEQPLPPYGACLLGSINLAALVTRPFEPEAALDEAALERLVGLAVRMLDNAISVSRFPLEAQRAEAEAKRRIGLGVTGLADALLLCGRRYGGAEAVALTRRWMEKLRDAAYEASVGLAAEKGAFPLFDADKYLAGETIATLPRHIRDDIRRYGIRNALVTSIAPTGTISLLADNISSGLEPVFAFHYQRSILEPDGSRRVEEVSDPAWRLWRQLRGEEAPLPDSFVTAESLTPEEHLAMQAAVQDYVDASVSKTVNLPADFPFEAFRDLYRQAHRLGLKGCTTYRPSALRGAVLQAAPKAPEKPPEKLGEKAPERTGDAPGEVVYMARPLDRPEILPGQTYKLKWPGSDHAIYITLNDVVQAVGESQVRRRPFEIFINSKNMEHYAWTVALTRMISAVFRRGGDVAFVVEELKAVFDPRGGAWMEGRYVPSLLAAIGGVIERHLIEIGFLAQPAGLTPKAGALRAVVGLEDAPGQCPRCGEAAYVHAEGCDLCTACGHSTCG